MTAVSGRQPAAQPTVAERAAEDDLRALFGQSIAVFASIAGPVHVVESANPAVFAVIVEQQARTGGAVADVVHE